jgi:hypothetical protein
VTPETAVVVIGDGRVSVYRSADAAVARLSAFDEWTAYDVHGRRLHLSGGWHRDWRLLGGEVSVEHGRRLEPRPDEPAQPDLVESLLRQDLEDDGAAAADGLHELVGAWARQHGWDD